MYVFDSVVTHYIDVYIVLGTISAGCGSGRYLHINSKVSKIGVDICLPLVESARKNGHEVLLADNLTLPFRDGIFDAVISIGVIHHFSTQSRRLQAVKEMCRLLRPGGQIMIYVWAFEQKHRKVSIWLDLKEFCNALPKNYITKVFSPSTICSNWVLRSLAS